MFIEILYITGIILCAFIGTILFLKYVDPSASNFTNELKKVEIRDVVKQRILNFEEYNYFRKDEERYNLVFNMYYNYYQQGVTLDQLQNTFNFDPEDICFMKECFKYRGGCNVEFYGGSFK